MSLAETGIADDTDGFPRRLISTDPMNREEAQAITHAIRTRATRLCQMVKEAHDGQAWKALDYDSFADYCDTEFNIGKSQAYRLIGHALTLEHLAAAAGLPADSPMGENLPERKLRSLPMPAVTEAIREAVMDLAADATTADRLLAVETTVAKIAATQPAPKSRKPKDDKASAGARVPAPVAPADSAANDGAIAPPVDAARAEEPEGDRTTAGADPGLVPGADSPSDDTPVVAGGTEGAAGVAGTPDAPSDALPPTADPVPPAATPSSPGAVGAGSAIPPSPKAIAAKVRTWRGLTESCESPAVLRKALAEACDLIEAGQS